MTKRTAAHRPRRSLILAGGGVKVAFQAGVLQVWLDEAGLEFDHADGASGGVFNLAMYCQGMSGSRIADNWRYLDPLKGIQPNWRAWLAGPFGQSIFKLDRYRRNVFTGWGLNWDEIRSTSRIATFNAYNFSRNELVVRTASDVTEDFVVSAVSLPMWFPPVVIDGDRFIDAVFITDANLEEAIERGADELWIIWTVSARAEWNPGFVAEYFQVIETAANGHFRRTLDRIRRSNDAIAAGDAGEFGRPIEIKLLAAEVPMHYLINLSRDRFAQAVELGVETARTWCLERGIPLKQTPAPAPAPMTGFRFTEEMHGFLAFGERDPHRGAAEGRLSGNALRFHLTIRVMGANRFFADPNLEAEANGWIHCESLGGRLPLERGRFNLFVDQGDPSRKRMLYRLWFRDGTGHPLTLSGFKRVEDDAGFDVWSDTTTLYVRVLRGHVAHDAEPDAEVVAAGILRLNVIDLAKQLATFRATAPHLGDRLSVLRRFFQLFTGRLWDVYAREVLPWSPF